MPYNFLHSADLISFVSPRVFIFIPASEFTKRTELFATLLTGENSPSYLFIPTCKYEKRGVPRNIDGPWVINIFRDLNHKLDPQTNLPANSCFRDSNPLELVRRMRLPYISRNVVGRGHRLSAERKGYRRSCRPCLSVVKAKSKEMAKKESRLPSGEFRFRPDVLPRAFIEQPTHRRTFNSLYRETNI